MNNKKLLRNIVVIALLLISIFVIFGIGYVYSGLKYVPPHYHANFAIYIQGVKIDLSADEFMEDVAACSLSGVVYPQSRVHMHNNDDDSIHIHAYGVSWEHFFNNIGYNIGSDFIYGESVGLLQNNENNSLQFVLNGEKLDFPVFNLINSEDTLLVYYGNEDTQNLNQAYNSIDQDAVEYNAKYDPGSCGGTNENSITVLVTDLLKSFSSEGHKH
ncbi:hypothetical protein GW846_02745 [Candidatus Gracilibacteria bacterium]|nr:hypothetical protein [Candidatus Gracilibacteria bacterium]